MVHKYIFNMNLTRYKNIDEAINAARKAGYPFIMWNGDLYFISDTDYFYTSIKAEDIGW